MKKIFVAIIVAMFLASLIPINMTSAGSIPAPEPLEAAEPQPIDGTPALEGKMVPWAQPDTGNTWTVIVSDDYTGEFYYQDFECEYEGVYCNIWIGLNDADWNGYQDEYVEDPLNHDNDAWYFAYPWTSVGYYPTGHSFLPGYRDVIYRKQLASVAIEFDTNIGAKCIEFFGGYSYRPGPFGDGKIQILIFNIRDAFFYGVFGVGFVMGYYWYYVSNLNNANIIHIDTWQWYRRQGPNPPGSAPYLDPPYSGPPPGGLLPNQYEGTIAHEFQHLIHRDNDYNELSWVNEGCSTLAEYICGYGHTSNLMNYMQYFWQTSLVVWQGQLSDYGVVYLWTLYMYEHYGGQPLIWDIVHEQANGIAGWTNVLKKHHIKKSFDEIFKDWAVANYLDDTSYADGIYGYYNLDLPCPSSGWWDIPYSIYYWSHRYAWFDIYVDAYPNYGYNYPYGLSLPYVVNYVEFYNSAPNLAFYFDGDDYVGIVPYAGMYEWYSDGSTWSWFRLGQTFDLTGVSAATLNFQSHYDIEEDWDYGYVEVHDLSTDEWYTLPGLETMSSIIPQDNPNCPDEFEPTAYVAAGRWNAFTGSSGGWYQETMDLTPFAGHNIELYFTYWTDGAVNWLGWYIDDIAIPEIGFSDGVESGADGWTANGWYISNGIVAFNDFGVEFVRTLLHNEKGKTWTTYDVINMELDDTTEDGWQYVKTLSTKTCAVVDPIVMVAANQPGYEHPFETFYWFYADIKP